MTDDAVLIESQEVANGISPAVMELLRVRYGDRQSFVIGDPHATSYHEGQRSVYLYALRCKEYVRDPKSRLVVVEEEAA